MFYDAWVQSASMQTAISGSELARMGYTYKRAGRAMLTTSFTTAAAFLATGASDIMPIAAFGIFAALSVTMNYVLVMTVFPCLLIIWERLGAKSCCCCNLRRGPSDRNSEDHQGTAVENNALAKDHSHDNNQQPRTPNKEAFEADDSGAEHVLSSNDLRWQERLFVDFYSPFISSKWRFVVMAMVAVWMVFSGYHALQMEPPTEQENGFAPEHMVSRVLDEEKMYLSGEHAKYVDVNLVWGIDTIDRLSHDRWVPRDRGVVQFVDQFNVLNAATPAFFEATCRSLRERTCTAEWCMDGSSKLVRPDSVTCFYDDWRKWYDTKTCNFCRDEPEFEAACPALVDSALNQLALEHFGAGGGTVGELFTHFGEQHAHSTACSVDLARLGSQTGIPDFTLADACPMSCRMCSASTENRACAATGGVPTPLLPRGQRFVDSLLEFRSHPEHYGTYGRRIGVIDGQLKFLVISVQSTLQWYQAIDQDLGMEAEFDRYMEERNAVAPVGVSDGFATGGRTWTWAHTRQGLVSNVFRGFAISFPAAFFTLLFVTRNILVSGFAIATIAGIVGCVLGTCHFFLGWHLGVAESLAAVIVVGFSVDFTVHFAHMYEESHHFDRVQKMAFAARTMGVTVLMGGMTTLGAGSFLFFCTLVFFYKFAILVTTTILFSMIAALFFFMPLLATIGPEGEFGNIGACVRSVQRTCGGERGDTTSRADASSPVASPVASPDAGGSEDVIGDVEFINPVIMSEDRPRPLGEDAE
eukprot:SAG31_NODE_3766_length_3902_cov_3.028399_1_plen_754_part_00